MHDATVVKCVSVIGVELDRSVKVPQRPAKVAFVITRITSVVIRIGIIGLEPDRLTVVSYLLNWVSGSKSQLEPLLSCQLLLLDLGSRVGCSLLFDRRSLSY